MTDAATSLADQSAGRADQGPGAPPAGRRGLRRWRRARSVGPAGLWDDRPTAVILDEATRLVEERDLGRATEVLAVAAATRPVGPERNRALHQLAVVAADCGRHRVSADAVYELQQISPRDADTWVTFANVALARGNHHHADTSARAALAQDDQNRGAWLALAGGYAGLGWFDQASDCLDRVDRASLSASERWRLGRSVNRWALGDTRWLLVAAISAMLVGVLAVAVASSVPFVVRTRRLRHLRGDRSAAAFATLAADAWRSEWRLRLGHAAVVVASVAAFAGVLALG